MKTLREGESGVEASRFPTASPNESQPQHTPGPWVVESADWPDDEPGIVRYYVRHDPPEIGMMNARLIAAAPDLLNACRAAAAAFNEIVHVLRQAIDHGGTRVHTEDVLAAVKQFAPPLTAVIAKAEGR